MVPDDGQTDRQIPYANIRQSSSLGGFLQANIMILGITVVTKTIHLGNVINAQRWSRVYFGRWKIWARKKFYWICSGQCEIRRISYPNSNGLCADSPNWWSLKRSYIGWKCLPSWNDDEEEEGAIAWISLTAISSSFQFEWQKSES